MPQLSEKHAQFCREYMIDLNASAAAVRCGYAESNSRHLACDLLKRDDIQQEIQRLMNERKERVKITADDVLKSIITVLNRAHGLTEIEELPDGTTRLREYKYDPRNALKASELLGKHLKLFTDVVHNTHEIVKMPSVTIVEGGAEKTLSFDIGSDDKHE